MKKSDTVSQEIKIIIKIKSTLDFQKNGKNISE